MLTRPFTLNRLPVMILVIAIILLVSSMIENRVDRDTDKVALRLGRRVEYRLERLDAYVAHVMLSESDNFVRLDDLPEDMVIYRYVNDSLQLWCNQFPVINDDISNRMVFQRLTGSRNMIVSPMSQVTEKVSFMSIGPKWYLVKAVNGNNNDRIIAGLEVKNTILNDLRRSENGVNSRLRLSDLYTIEPLMESGGSPVVVNDVPLFKVFRISSTESVYIDNVFLRWMSIILMALAMMLYFAKHRTIKVYLIILVALYAMFSISSTWSFRMSGSSALFSPMVYADGPLMFSLGMLLLVNTFLTIFHLCTYLVVPQLSGNNIRDPKKRRCRLAVFGGATVLALLGTLVFMHLTLDSLISNSNISLDIYKMSDNMFFSLLVYLSYFGIFICLLLQLQSLRPVLREFKGIRVNFLTKKFITFFAVLGAVYLTLMSSMSGFKKEQDTVMVWANRLAVDRDLGLELQLRSVEEEIASDQLVTAMMNMQSSDMMIQSRISEYYLNRLHNSYSLSVKRIVDERANVNLFNELIHNSEPIAPNSRFLYVTGSNGRGRYVGLFSYYTQDMGLTRLMVEITSNSNKDDKGYNSILGKFSGPGEINIPEMYSYAKYKDGRLILYKGNFAYPTIFTEELDRKQGRSSILRDGKHVHFVSEVSEDEIIVISRPSRNGLMFFTSFSYVFLVLLGSFCLCFRSKRKESSFKKDYFKNRINLILFLTSVLMLVVMTTISVIFVYKRNEVNMRNLMSSKVSTVQALIETHVREVNDYRELIGSDFLNALENISNTNKCDIALYSPEGKVFHSTNPEIFEKMLVGSRVHKDTYYNIRYKYQRYHIHRTKIADYEYWSLSAPIFNYDGKMLAIMSMPYTARDYDFRREASFHSALIINLFLLLLIMSLLISTKEVNELFRPLVAMGKKMTSSDINKLEHIVYKREDEVSDIVDAYNRMVTVITESTIQLAQAERDKAWSEMARQVAHEIKNPLTPIKLEIQRLIRLKQKNNPAWEEKFDNVSAVILEHIDILTDTANEFSTFAKLYSEEPVVLDLDKTIKDQMVIYGDRDNIQLQYIGLENAYVLAPKPQLIRVFVNLINNAIQAVEIRQKEEDGDVIGKVMISLRNSTKDGCYDIVVEDNGFGVKDENLEKLFTPNFTTKSGGTGLGLAISRNIVEKCSGEIYYQRSFILGGACFVVSLPKYNDII